MSVRNKYCWGPNREKAYCSVLNFEQRERFIEHPPATNEASDRNQPSFSERRGQRTHFVGTDQEAIALGMSLKQSTTRLRFAGLLRGFRGLCHVELVKTPQIE